MTKKLLVVDDDQSILDMIKYAFSKEGYDVVTATDGENAKKVLFEHFPDIIILDVLMPKVDGFEFLKSVRCCDEFKKTPVIIVSAVYRSFNIIQKTIKELGANDYFTKPFELKQLVNKVKELCPSITENVSEAEDCYEQETIYPKNKYLFIESVPENSELSVFPIFKVLADYYNNRKSGILIVSDKSVVKKIVLNDGIPIEVSSNIAAEWLGRLLVREKVITDSEYKKTLELMARTNKKHGEVLLDFGLLSPHDLYEYLKMQMTEKITNMFSWNEGAYYFSSKVKINNISPKKINIHRMILDGIKSRLSSELIKSELSEIRDDSVFILNSKEGFINQCALTGAESRFLNSFDGHRDIAAVLNDFSDTDIGEFEVLLYTLLIFNAVSLIDTNVMEQTDITKASKHSLKEPVSLSIEDKKIIHRVTELFKKLPDLNYHELLGVQKIANKNEIKKAYFNMAKEFHPDKFSPRQYDEIRGRASKIFSEMANAYQTLLDDDLRKKYEEKEKYAQNNEDLQKANELVAAEMQFQKGRSYLRSKDYNKAHDSFKWSVKLNPDEAEYHLYYAITIFKDPEYDSPEKHFKVRELLNKVISMNNALDKAHYYLGELYKLQDDNIIAKKCFNKALSLNPKNIKAKRELRLMEMRAKKKEGFFKGIFK